MKVFTNLLTLTLLATTTAATSWRGQPPLPCPKNIKNICTPAEAAGFDFADLTPGTELISYKSYFFRGGWRASRAPGKGLKNRSFNSECVSADLDADTPDDPVIEAEKDFSVGEIDVSVDVGSVELELEYTMPGGKKCRKSALCGKGGVTIKNNQCGGARSVVVKLPKRNKTKRCKVFIHKIKFECGGETVEVPVPTTKIVPPAIETTTTTTTQEVVTTTTTTEVAPVETPSCGGEGQEECQPDCENFPELEGCPPVSQEPDCETDPEAEGCLPVEEETPDCEADPEAEGCAPVEEGPDCESHPEAEGCTPAEETPDCSADPEAEGCAPVEETPDCEADPEAEGCAPVEETPDCEADPEAEGCAPVEEGPDCESDPEAEGCPPVEETPDCSADPTADGCPPDCKNFPELDGCPPVYQTPDCDEFPAAEGCTATTTILGNPATSTGPIQTPTNIPDAEPVIPCTDERCPACGVPGKPDCEPTLPAPPTDCPDLVPQCLKTWIHTAGSCTDTADASCFCPAEGFIQTVVECINSWGDSPAEINAGITYFLGLCSGFVAENPDILTCVPDTVTIVQPTPIPGSGEENGSPTVPEITVTATITKVVPCEPTLIDGEEVFETTETITETVTVPQVGLIVTDTDAELIYQPTPTPDVDTPVDIPAETTGAAPESTVASVPVETGVEEIEEDDEVPVETPAPVETGFPEIPTYGEEEQTTFVFVTTRVGGGPFNPINGTNETVGGFPPVEESTGGASVMGMSVVLGVVAGFVGVVVGL